MIEELKPYDAYRSAEIPWARMLPSHWQLRRTKTLLRERVEKGYPSLPLLAATQTKGVIPKSHYETRTVTATKDLHLLKLVVPGDFVISLRSFQGGIEIAHARGIISPAYTVLAPRLSQSRGYLRHFFKSSAFIDAMTMFVTGIREGQNIDYSRLARTEVPQPPPEEQEAIVRFLDHTNRRIDQFIRAKKKLIALVNEQKQAIIHRAVTRGLDPGVKLKDSGVPWLGEVPAHWGVTRLKFEASHIIDCLHATPPYQPDGLFPAIRTADIEPGRVRLEQARRLSEADFVRWTQRLEPAPGDILYSREGERFGLAAPVPAGVRLCISQRMMVFRIRPAQRAAYIMWQLNCPHVYQQASEHINGSTSPHVNVEQIKNFLLVLPPRDEQARIVAHIDTELGAIAPALRRAEKEIELAREFRTRLISDVVTGQLDVRAVAASLPALEVDASQTDDSDEVADVDDTEAA